MKIFAIIPLIIAYFISQAQISRNHYVNPDDLNGYKLIADKGNEKTVAFIEANIGKKIRAGICYQLVQGAYPKYSFTRDKKYFKRVKKPLPGDMLEFKEINHVGLVYQVFKDGGIVYVEQNADVSLVLSRVGKGGRRIDKHDLKKKVKIYRYRY